MSLILPQIKAAEKISPSIRSMVFFSFVLFSAASVWANDVAYLRGAYALCGSESNEAAMGVVFDV